MNDKEQPNRTFKKRKTYLISTIILGLITLILFIFIFLKGPFNTLVKSIVVAQVGFEKDNVDVWGTFPGKNDIIIVNNITFFNHSLVDESKSKKILRLIKIN